MSGPLEDLRVIDFGQYVAGPLAALLLADQGAEVVHVDPPGGPRLTGIADAVLNRGKRRVVLDLKDPADRSTARRLVQSADVLVENFRPGVMGRLGLGAAETMAEAPWLIYCSLPGFPDGDPRSGMRGWEGIIDAATANCHPRVGEEPKGWDWDRPTHSALPLASSFAGYLGATSVVMAAIARRRTNRGQLVQVPLFDAMFTLIGHAGAFANHKGLHPPAPIHGRGAGCFACSDGRYVQFDTSSPRHLTWFARHAGLTGFWEPELLDLNANRDPRVNERLHERLRELFLTRTAVEWEELGNRAGAAIGAVRTVREWIETEHARRTGAVIRVEDPELGPAWVAGAAITRVEPADGTVAPPRHLPGADQDQVLEELAALPPRVASEARTDHDPPLAGVRVLDLGVALAGPTAGRLLAEFGAEVIKISPPNGGVGGYLNRGKRSVLLDVRTLPGQEVFWKLVERSDVVLENFSPGTADRLGIGYQEARSRRPDLVYTSVSAYGYGGPWTERRGWERQGQAVTGIMERTDEPSVLGPYNLADLGTGVLGTFATGVALYERIRQGRGRHVSASLVQTCTYHQALFMSDRAGEPPTEPRGYDALGEGPLQRYYQARDGWLFLAAVASEGEQVGRVLGLSWDPSLGPERLEEELERRFRTGDAAHWVNGLRAAGIAAQEVVALEDLMTDATVRARGLSVVQEVEGPGACTMPGVSVSLSETPARTGTLSGRPGSDAPQILAELGLADQLARLEAAWVLRSSSLPPVWQE